MTQENHLRSGLVWRAVGGASVGWAGPEVGGGIALELSMGRTL